MPLLSETWTVEEALDELQERLDELGDTMDDLDPPSQRYQALTQQKQQLTYMKHGLEWMRDGEGDVEAWGADAEITLEAMTAGEKAHMRRVRNNSGDIDELELWFVAAATGAAPYHVGGDIGETFDGLCQVHEGVIEWAKAKANALEVPGDSGNG